MLIVSRSNLLLGQAPDQRLNQSRLETYLSSTAHPELDLSTHLSNALSNGHQSGMNGTNTPKDLTSRIKILELFTLHVLPRNGEWDYAKSILSNSDILDEERREAFMQTLHELQEASEKETLEQAEEDIFEETEEEFPVQQEPTSGASLGAPSQSQGASKHQRTSSEVDYGIERAHPNGGHAPAQQENTTSKAAKDTPLTKLPPQPTSSSPSAARSPPPPPAAAASSSASTINRTHLSPPAQTPRRPTRKPKTASQNALLAQARALFLALSNLARNLAGTISKNPTAMLRFLLFVLAFVMAFSQRQVRERVRRVMDKSWEKVRGTVGMGVKVSYI